MKFTLSWLKEYLKTDKDINTILENLTNIGLEVEEYFDQYSVYKDFKVAKIISTKKHPNADRLQLCLVDIGNDKIEVVCGAKNAKEGLTTIYAPVGSTIPDSGFKLKKAKIRGVESLGMLCSKKELRLGEDSEGIAELSDNFRAGKPITDALNLNDIQIEIAITPNRPDCLGVYGIARDLAAAGVGKLIERDKKEISVSGEKFPIFLDYKNQNDACSIFSGRVIKNVKNTKSPEWLINKLEAIGLRSVNCLVDITNYINFDQGRPLHVYDLEKISKKIGARNAKKGEEIQALDGKNYKLDDDICVIADDEKVLGIGGIMGGEYSGSSMDTTEIFLESAYFDPVQIALSGRKLNIMSDSRYRFERGVDPTYVLEGLEYATNLIIELCGGTAEEISVIDNRKFVNKKINFTPELVKKMTGLEIENKIISEILLSLGFKVSNDWELTVPSWRPDVSINEDIVEEVVRVYGLNNIKSEPLFNDQQPSKSILTNKQKNLRLIRRIIASRGLLETISYSFINEQDAIDYGGGINSLKVLNPISEELSDMRPTPLASIINTADENSKRGYGDLGIFELGPGFSGKNADDQIIIASGIRTGSYRLEGYGKDWQGYKNVDVFDAKKDVISVLEELGVNNQKIKIKESAPKYYHPGRSGQILTEKGNIVANFGEIHPKIIKEKDFNIAVGFEIFLDCIDLLQERKSIQTAPNIYNLQPLKRDFSFIVSNEVSAQTIIKAAMNSDNSLIKSVKIFDQFLNEKNKSIAIEITIQPIDHTLTDHELEEISLKVINSVESATKGKLRS